MKSIFLHNINRINTFKNPQLLLFLLLLAFKLNIRQIDHAFLERLKTNLNSEKSKTCLRISYQTQNKNSYVFTLELPTKRQIFNNINLFMIILLWSKNIIYVYYIVIFIYFNKKSYFVFCTCSFTNNDQYSPLNTASSSVNNKN